jgi:hypothetical protein
VSRFHPLLNAARCSGCKAWIAEDVIRWYWTLGSDTYQVCLTCAGEMAAFARDGNQSHSDQLTKAYAIEYRRRSRR